jgi:predicted ABC-type ATPase
MALPPTIEPPSLWIIAGPNGSGKSSAYGMASVEAPSGSVWIINPDLLTARIASHEGLSTPDANLEAVVRIERWLNASVDTHQTIGVETVLSKPKYRNLVTAARAQGFRINLIYVFLDTVELNIERVRTRVLKGGHAVPEDKIAHRRLRSFAQFGWFFAAADRVDVYNNSGATPRRVLAKRGDLVEIYDRLPSELIAAIAKTNPEVAAAYAGVGD